MPDTERTYGTVVTSAGLALVTAATMRGEKVKLKYLAVGDGGGQYYQPSADMTALKNEKWRGEVNSVQINPDSPNMIDIVAVIPATVGGFTIREMSVQTEGDDVMFAVCNTPDTEKVIITTGAAGEVELTMHIEVANAANVTIAVDPNVVTATKTDLKNHNADPDAHGGVLPRLEVVENSLVPIYTGTEKPTADGPFLWLQVIQQGGDVVQGFTNDIAGLKTAVETLQSGMTKVEHSDTNGNVKVDGAEVVVYQHPATHPASMITDTAEKVMMTAAERTKLGGVAAGDSAIVSGTGTVADATAVPTLMIKVIEDEEPSA